MVIAVVTCAAVYRCSNFHIQGPKAMVTTHFSAYDESTHSSNRAGSRLGRIELAQKQVPCSTIPNVRERRVIP
jgi:hypothetical protein